MQRRTTPSALCGVLLSALCTNAFAALPAYDGFANGPLSTLDGSNGGGGWTGPWIDSGSVLMTAVAGPGLTFPGLAVAPGGAVTEPFNGFDATSYERPFGSVAGDRLFVSFLYRPSSNYGSYGGIQFGSYPNFVFVGSPLGYYQYGLRVGRYGFHLSSAPEVPDVTVFLVLEIQSLPATNQSVYRLFVDPTVGAPPPNYPMVDAVVSGATLPTALFLVNDGGVTTDELRVGSTWQSVTPAAGPPRPGDTNCDASIDFFDIDPFLLALFDAAGYAAAYPTCALASADCNADSAVDFFDIDPFLTCLFAGSCP